MQRGFVCCNGLLGDVALETRRIHLPITCCRLTSTHESHLVDRNEMSPAMETTTSQDTRQS